MRAKCVLEDYQVADVRRLRENYPEFMGYLDDEIANCFSLYCEMFHAAGWTKVNDDEFVTWATKSPIENMKSIQTTRI